MRIIRILSVIGLAAFLVLQGLFFMLEQSSPIIESLIGIIGLGTGVLMFISLSHWIDIRKEK